MERWVNDGAFGRFLEEQRAAIATLVAAAGYGASGSIPEEMTACRFTAPSRDTRLARARLLYSVIVSDTRRREV
jgi:hypothetical protein